MSQTQLGEAVGVNYATVGAWERGETTPHPRSMAAIRKALGVAADSTRRSMRGARLAAGLSQDALARKIGMANGTQVSLWERGLRPVPGDWVQALGDVLRPFGYGRPVAEAAEPEAQECIAALRRRAWEHGFTISTAHEGRFTMYRADVTPAVRVTAHKTITAVRVHVERLEELARSASATRRAA